MQEQTGNIRKEMKILRKNNNKKKKNVGGSKPAMKIKNAPGGVISRLAMETGGCEKRNFQMEK